MLVKHGGSLFNKDYVLIQKLLEELRQNGGVGGGSGGSTTLIGLNDVVSTNKINGYTLLYNSSNKKFELMAVPKTIVTSSSNGKIKVDGTDVNVYDDSAVVNSLASKANISHSHKLSDIQDIDHSQPSEGDVLQFKDGIWKPAFGLTSDKVYSPKIPSSGLYELSTIIYNSNPIPNSPVGWICTTKGEACNIPWESKKAYSVGQRVAANGNVYECKSAGTSGNTAPFGGDVGIIDGTVSWSFSNKLAVFYEFGFISSAPADNTPPIVTLSPASGAYATVQNITITTNEPATIYYTIDGSEPTTSSAVYTAPFSLSTDTTIKYFAKDAAGNVSEVKTSTFVIDMEAPYPVETITFTDIKTNSVSFTWKKSTSNDVNYYEVASSTDNFVSNEVVHGTVNDTTSSYTIVGLTSGKEYTIRIIAADFLDNRSTPTIAKVTTLSAEVTIPDDVTNLKATNVAETTLTLSWDASAKATSYDIYLDAALLTNTTSTSYNVSGLNPNTSYTMKVVAKNSAGSSTGKSVTATTADTSFGVSNLKSENVTSSSISVSWALSTANVQKYEVAYSSDNGTTFTVANASIDKNANYYTISGLTTNKAYVIRVVAIDTGNGRSTPATLNVSTSAAETKKLYMNGKGDTFVAKSGLSYTRVVLDFLPQPNTVDDDIIIELAGGSIRYRTGSDFIFNAAISAVYSNGLLGVHNGNDFIKDNTRTLLDIRLNKTATEQITLFKIQTSGGNNSYPKGVIYSLKVYNGENVVAYYDMSKGDVLDKSGNKNDGVLTGGLWMNDSVAPVDTVPPYEISNLNVNSMTGTTATLQWTKSPSRDVTKYKIYQNDTFLAETTTTSYNLTGLTNNTVYKYSVRTLSSTGLESSGFTFKMTTGLSQVTSPLPPTVANLALNLEFRGNEGRIENYYNDSVNNIKATMPYAFNYQNKINNMNYGWIDKDGYKTIGGVTNTNANKISVATPSSALASLDVSKGFSIEFGVKYIDTADLNDYICSINNKLDIYFNTTNLFTVSKVAYKNTSGVEKTTNAGIAAGSGTLKHISSNELRNINDTVNPKGELNQYNINFRPDGVIEIVSNEFKYTSTKIADFDSWANWFNTTDQLYIGGGQGSQIAYFRVYNKVLTDQEIASNYGYYKLQEELKAVNIVPATVDMAVGGSQYLLVNAVPSYYNRLLTNEFESGNAGFVTVTNDGLLSAINEGQTNVSVRTTYKDKVFDNLVLVNIGAGHIDLPASSRTLSGVSINKKTNNMVVGEFYALIATTLPYDIMYDNLVTWDSSNPNVCSVNYGVLEAKSAGTSTITAWDSTKTFSESFQVTVTNSIPVVITEAETYNVPLIDYGIKSNNTDATNTTKGIINALAYASINKYKKIVFPYGTYLVTPMAGTINMPSDMIIDFSNSVMNIEFSAKTATGYIMIMMDKIKYTKLMNLHVFGEADSVSLAASTEGDITLNIVDAYKSGVENCTFSKSPGFNFITGNTLTKPGTGSGVFSFRDIEAGDIKDDDGTNGTNTVYCFRSNKFIDISTVGDIYMLGYNQGYWGYNLLRSRLYSIYFYDANKTYIGCQKYNHQHVDYDKPANAKFAKIVIYQDNAPTSGDLDFNGAIAFIRTMAFPRKCYIINCKFEDNYSCGVAMCGGQDWLIENNSFSRNGRRMPACDIDWEDGWDAMIGDIVKGNTFNSMLGVTIAAGNSLAFFDNKFNNSYVAIWNRTQNWKMFNNTFDGKGGGSANLSLGTQGESYFARNILRTIRFTTNKAHSTALYDVRQSNNNLI